MQRVLMFVMLSLVGLGLPVNASGQEVKKESPSERRERLAIAIQAICPVTGESLKINAKPVKMVLPESKEVLYVCCDDCVKEKPDAKHLEIIRRNLANAQGKCLVMSDNEISEKSKSTVLNGRFVYVCCPPCSKKMAADPEKFLRALDDRYEAALKKK